MVILWEFPYIKVHCLGWCPIMTPESWSRKNHVTFSSRSSWDVGHIVSFVPKFVPLRQDPCSMATGTPLKRSVPLWPLDVIRCRIGGKSERSSWPKSYRFIFSILSFLSLRAIDWTRLRFTYSGVFHGLLKFEGSFKNSCRDSRDQGPLYFTFIIHSHYCSAWAGLKMPMMSRLVFFFAGSFETYIIISGDGWTIHICSP